VRRHEATDDDTTGSFLRTSRHGSVWIEAAPEVVYEFASDPHEWRRWAAGLDTLRRLLAD
jgi:hypothetical protein